MTFRARNILGQTILCLGILSSVCEAYIRIVESGREFRSWPDDDLGPRLEEGEVYKARLQQLKGNSHLCEPQANWNVTVPADGSPVALMVKRGICSYEMKARHASNYIYPPGVVKFLIIDGDSHIAAEDEEYDADMRLDTPMSGISDITDFSPEKDLAVDGMDMTGSMVTTLSSFDVFPRALRRKRSKDDGDISVSVFHVTYATGYNLLELLLREFPSVQKSGGTLIELTGDIPYRQGQKFQAIWTCLIVLMCMSGILCLLSVLSAIFDVGQTATQAPNRPHRRRLTPWQVREKFRVGVFDGTQVIFDRSSLHGDSEELLVDRIPQANENTTPLLPAGEGDIPDPVVLTDECCTICLDEYSPGDKLRTLPCHHAFHSKCIGKWLTERSATCPLCKIDLYESDDEEEDEEAPASRPNALTSSWNSVPPETPAAAPEAATQTLFGEERWRQHGRALGAWGRSLFRRRLSSPEVATRNGADPMSEPLLTEEVGQTTTNGTSDAHDGNAVESSQVSRAAADTQDESTTSAEVRANAPRARMARV